MKLKAVMLIGQNTFISIGMQNHDDSINVMESDANELASKLGAQFIYFEDMKEQTNG